MTGACGAFCQRPSCVAARVAGDVAARMSSLPHQDVSEGIILRRFSADVFLCGVAPGPGVKRTRAELGDVACFVDIGASAYFRITWPEVVAKLAERGELTPFELRALDLAQRHWANVMRAAS